MEAKVIKLTRYKVELILDTVECDALKGMIQNPIRPDENHIDAHVREKMWEALVQAEKR